MTCPICNGSGERDGEYGLLSCDAPNCTAANERAALEAANKAAEPMTVYDQRWFSYGLGKMAQVWISVDDRLPEVGTWCNVLMDRNLGDFWDRLNKPEKEVFAAQLREIDNEGHAYWQRWQMSDGGPMGSMTLVSHWMPFPSVPA